MELLVRPAKRKESVTKSEFEAYVRVQHEGLFNMLSHEAFISTGLDKATYRCIINNYTYLKSKYSV